MIRAVEFEHAPAPCSSACTQLIYRCHHAPDSHSGACWLQYALIMI